MQVRVCAHCCARGPRKAAGPCALVECQREDFSALSNSFSNPFPHKANAPPRPVPRNETETNSRARILPVSSAKGHQLPPLPP